MAQGEYGGSRGIMTIKQILWVLAIFVFTGALYAQRGPQPPPTAPQQPGIQQPTPGISGPEVQKGGSQVTTNQKAKQGAGPLSEKDVTKDIKNNPARLTWPDSVLDAIQENYMLTKRFNCNCARFVYQPRTQP